MFLPWGSITVIPGSFLPPTPFCAHLSAFYLWHHVEFNLQGLAERSAGRRVWSWRLCVKKCLQSYALVWQPTCMHAGWHRCRWGTRVRRSSLKFRYMLSCWQPQILKLKLWNWNCKVHHNRTHVAVRLHACWVHARWVTQVQVGIYAGNITVCSSTPCSCSCGSASACTMGDLATKVPKMRCSARKYAVRSYSAPQSNTDCSILNLRAPCVAVAQAGCWFLCSAWKGLS